MKYCAFLSMDSLEEFECYDSLTVEPLKARGWQVDVVSWRSHNVNWDCYDLVIIRSPWDYQNDPLEFLAVLKQIEASSAILANSLEIVEWNINKRYLQSLLNKGIKIVPTVFRDFILADELKAYFQQFDTNEIILKPSVSANADDTFRLSRVDIEKNKHTINTLFQHRDCMVQPFMASVVEEGEYSLFYFNGHLSHAILKRPAKDDFRVQEEHGGSLIKIRPEESLVESGHQVLKAIGENLLYARLDFVRSKSNFCLMEAELIEPSLYFNLDDKAACRFADAVVQFTI